MEINSYLVSDNIVGAYERASGTGPDYLSFPALSEIRQAFDSRDTKLFLATVAKLAEERRGAASDDERAKAVSATSNPDNVFNE